MPVGRTIRADHQQILMHTWQHYDYCTSQTFFGELVEMSVPDYNLGAGSASQARQIAEIMLRMEEVLFEKKRDLVTVRRYSNSTMATARVTSKLNIPFTISNYVIMLAAFSMMFGEKITLSRLFGTLVIGIGVSFIS
jgi:UDP-N-acetylglucosamine 2-epimerase